LDDLSARALETAKFKGAQYADVRVVHSKDEDISVKDGVVESLRANETLGFGVRVLVDGTWGLRPRDAVITGMTRDGVFMIENG